jgi:hypothetical protein
MLTCKVQECFEDQVKYLRETYSPVWNPELEAALEKLYGAGFLFIFEADDLEYEDRPEMSFDYASLHSVDPYVDSEILAKWNADRERFLASRDLRQIQAKSAQEK